MIHNFMAIIRDVLNTGQTVYVILREGHYVNLGNNVCAKHVAIQEFKYSRIGL
jgi:hypothetical protein